MKQTTIIQAIAASLVLLFFYTALAKLRDPAAFQAQLALQPVVQEAAGVLAWGIPGISLLVCLLLVFVKTQFTGFYLATGLLLAFTTYIGLVMLPVWEEVPCSCAGVFNGLSWEEHFLLNLLFIAIAGTGLILSWNQKRRSRAGRALPPGIVAYLKRDK